MREAERDREGEKEDEEDEEEEDHTVEDHELEKGWHGEDDPDVKGHADDGFWAEQHGHGSRPGSKQKPRGFKQGPAPNPPEPIARPRDFKKGRAPPPPTAPPPPGGAGALPGVVPTKRL